MMKKSAFILFLFFVHLTMEAQSRVYLSGGLTSSFGGNLNTMFAKERFGYGVVDLEWERKMMGSFHSIIGLSYFGVGYSSKEDLFGSMSNFKGSYLGVPVLLRFNVGDKNNLYIDAGPCPYMLLKATLEEGVTRFGTMHSEQANITAYSNRFFMAFRFQATFAFNRFTISEFLMWQGEGNSSTKDLADHWFLNAQESTYLLSRGYSDFLLFGVKVGVRLK